MAPTAQMIPIWDQHGPRVDPIWAHLGYHGPGPGPRGTRKHFEHLHFSDASLPSQVNKKIEEYFTLSLLKLLVYSYYTNLHAAYMYQM